MSDAHENRQLGGYKATLHNDNTSRQAKLHAAEILEAHGITSAPDVTIQHPAEKHKHLNPTEPTTYRDPHRHGHEHTHGSPSGGVKTEDGRGGVKAEGMHLRSQDKHEDGGMKTRSQD